LERKEFNKLKVYYITLSHTNIFFFVTILTLELNLKLNVIKVIYIFTNVVKLLVGFKIHVFQYRIHICSPCTVVYYYVASAWIFNLMLSAAYALRQNVM